MPNDRAFYGAMLGGGAPRSPWEQSYGSYGDRGGYSIGDLVARRGQLQAQRYQQGADTLAQGFQQAMQGLGDFFTERGRQQEMTKRNEATFKAIESWDGQDPRALFTTLHKIRPDDALQYTQTLMALRKGPQQDPQAELGRFGTAARWIADHSDEEVSKAWPFLRQSFGDTATKLFGGPPGEQWDPQMRGLVQPAADMYGPKKEKGKLTAYKPGDYVVNEAGDLVLQVPDKPAKPETVETVDANGRPITKAVTPEELAKGVPKYVAPKQPMDIGSGKMQWALDPNTGEERLMTNAEIRSAGAGRPDTADMRNKAKGREFVRASVDAIRDLSDKVITKNTAAVQKAVSAGRTVESVIGNDPDFRVYQDARRALAGNLAVAQQGSRPSDADIQAIWLPMVPDVFSDTKDSAAMKWKLIDTMSQPKARGPIKPIPPKGPKAGDVEDGWRYVGGDPSKQSSWQKVR